jgi:hypothetical protein
MLIPTIAAYGAALSIIVLSVWSFTLAVRAFDSGRSRGPAGSLGALSIGLAFGLICGMMAGGQRGYLLPPLAQLVVFIAILCGPVFGSTGVLLRRREKITAWMQLPGGKRIKITE